VNTHSGPRLSETTLAGLRSFPADPNVDGLVLALGTVFMQEVFVAWAVPGLMETYGKPVRWWIVAGAEEEQEAEIEKEKKGVAIFRRSEHAVKVLRKLGDYWQFLQDS
jgi:acyl-CoA synthetase (NDP forming)